MLVAFARNDNREIRRQCERTSGYGHGDERVRVTRIPRRTVAGTGARDHSAFAKHFWKHWRVVTDNRGRKYYAVHGYVREDARGCAGAVDGARGGARRERDYRRALRCERNHAGRHGSAGVWNGSGGGARGVKACALMMMVGDVLKCEQVIGP